MSGGNRLPTAWAHSDYCTAPCRTRSQGTFGRDDVLMCDSLGGRKQVVNLTGRR
jgi:hypothetical protein